MSTTHLLCCIIAGLIILCLHYYFKAKFYKEMAGMHLKSAQNATMLTEMLSNKIKQLTK